MKNSKQEAADAALQAHVLLDEVLRVHRAIDSIEANPTGRWKTWSKRFTKILEAHPRFVVEDAESLVRLLRAAAEEKSGEAYELSASVVAYFKAESSEPQ